MDYFATFTENVEKVIGRSGQDRHACARGVASELEALLEHPDFLAEEYRRPGKEEPRAHVVYVSPDRSFSVVSFVWKPGQQTCIHDHACWCVVGVLQGSEAETRYRLMENGAGQRWLEPLEVQRVTPGHVCQLVPPEEDIHQVKNVGEGLAISLHVYGTDISRRGTSINHRFDLPVREGALGRPVNWREVFAEEVSRPSIQHG